MLLACKPFRILIIFLLLLGFFVLLEFGKYFIVSNKSVSKSIEKELLQLRELKTSIVLNAYNDLSKHEFRVYSQNGEDGVLFELITMFDLNNNKTSSRFYVEIGTENGKQCNTRFLRRKLNWKGIMFDSTFSDESIGLHKEVFTHSNVLQIFRKYSIKKSITVLSVDTDYADFWILEAILTRYRPKVVIHEVNYQTPDKCVVVQKPVGDKLEYWDGSEYFGGSVCAFLCLANKFRYTMVYCETRGVNCFWVRNDILENHLRVDVDFVRSILTPQFLFKSVYFGYRKSNKLWQYISC